MNQQQLIDAIHANGTRYIDRGLQKNEIKAVLDTLADIAREELGTEGGEVPLPGLGKLKADTRAARVGRNPKTGEAIEIPARNTVKFTAAKALKDAVA